MSESRTLEEYLSLPYTEWVRPDTDEGGFYAGVEELPGCLADGETRAQALEALQDAKRSWLATALEFGDEIPLPLSLQDYSGKILVRAPKSLHRDLAHRAALEGVSLNQLCVSLLSRGLGLTQARPVQSSAASAVDDCSDQRQPTAAQRC
jgi:antitoxin HicB